MEYMCFNKKGDISTLNGGSLKIVDKLTYPGSSVSSTENGLNIQLAKTWLTIDRLSIIWKSDISDKIKCDFFQAAVVSILFHGGTTWMLNKEFHKNTHNFTRILRSILNRSWKQHPTKKQLYGHLPPISKTIQIRRTRHKDHCWRSKEKLM